MSWIGLILTLNVSLHLTGWGAHLESEDSSNLDIIQKRNPHKECVAQVSKLALQFFQCSLNQSSAYLHTNLSSCPHQKQGTLHLYLLHSTF